MDATTPSFIYVSVNDITDRMWTGPHPVCDGEWRSVRMRAELGRTDR